MPPGERVHDPIGEYTPASREAGFHRQRNMELRLSGDSKLMPSFRLFEDPGRPQGITHSLLSIALLSQGLTLLYKLCQAHTPERSQVRGTHLSSMWNQ